MTKRISHPLRLGTAHSGLKPIWSDTAFSDVTPCGTRLYFGPINPISVLQQTQLWIVKMSSEKDVETKNSVISPDDLKIGKYGIERVPAEYFHYREFRYTNVEDAIAQAKRDETPQAMERLS